MLRPLLVSPYANIGGAEMLLRWVVEAMSDDCDPAVVLMQDGALADMLVQGGIPTDIEHLTGRWATRRFPAVARRLADRFSGEEISLVHANGIKAAMLGLPLARRLGVPLVWMKHDHVMDGFPTLLVGVWCDRIVCVSETMMAALPKFLRGRASVVYPGTRLPITVSQMGSRKLIVASGRLDPAKGFEDLLRATAILRARGIEAEIAVAGPLDRVHPGHRDELVRLVSELGLAEVARVGLADDLSALYSAARVVAIASRPGRRGRPGEGAPVVLLEGMAHGRPVVAPREGGIMELVGDAGTLLEDLSPDRLADALEVYLCNPKTAFEVGRRGRRRVEERFTIDHVVHDLKRVYEEVVSHRKGRASVMPETPGFLRRCQRLYHEKASIPRRVRDSVQRLRRERRPARFILSRILWWGGLSRWLVIRFPEGYRLRFHPSAMSAFLWVDPDYNRDDREVLAQVIPRGGVVVDVGANVGSLTVAAAWTVGPTGQVFAVEPHPTVFSYLEDNVALNGLTQVHCLQFAAGATHDGLRMSDLRRSDPENTVDIEGALPVPGSPLDDLIPDGLDIDLLKIDVEGYERFVLEGAHSTLARTKRVYLEVWDEHFKRFGYRTKDVLDLLRERGFEIYRADGKSKLSSADQPGRECENLLAIRPLD